MKKKTQILNQLSLKFIFQSSILFSKFIALIYLAILFSINSFSQFGFETLEHDFGDVYAGNKRFVDLKFKNTTDKNIYLLLVKHDRTVRTLVNSKTVKPDSTLIIRFKYNPTEKGRFKIKIPVFLSNSYDPFFFTLKGNIKEIDNSMGMDCPSFEKKSIAQDLDFEFTATVLDKNTKKPIQNASIVFIKNGTVVLIKKTNRKGIVKTKIPIGLYYFVINAEDYLSTEFQKYVNRQNDSILVLLEKPELVVVNELPEVIEKPEAKIKDTITKEIIKEEPFLVISQDTFPELTITKNIIPKLTIDTSFEIETKPIPKEILTDFPEIKYKPNNLVFLLDISSSMRKEGKLDLLKASMIEMVGVLREVDKITIITYSTFAKVVLKTTTGNNKEEIISIIQNIKGEGMTAGATGMKLAYRHARNNFVKGGNNQIIMATDGNFNKGNTKIERLVSKNKERGVLISVMGIKNKPEHSQDMQKISTLGGGTYLHIDNYMVSKEILIQEIKRNSTK